MELVKIKFLDAGRWMDQPYQPILEVEKGEVREVSTALAKTAIDAGRAEAVPAKQPSKPKGKAKSKSGPKAKQEGSTAVPKAESDDAS